MKNLFPVIVLGFVFLSSCKSYNDKEYGPEEFSTAFEDGDEWLFEGPVEAIAVLNFNPEEYGFSKENVGGMRLKTISLNTDNENGFGVFESLKIEVSSPNTEMLTIGVLNSVPDANSVEIQGLDQSKIKNFKEVDEYYLHISGNLKNELESSFNVSGELTLAVESSDE